jgi:aerobic-type carbon monoxide dehydrogenase small subunit (CoxS/CutS family)
VPIFRIVRNFGTFALLIMPKVTELHINGKSYKFEADAEETLLWVLRDRLGLTGSKYGCGEGQCGACTVLVNGNPRRSCITKVGAVAGKSLTTIEGLEKNGRLHPLQQAFLDAEALQCGYCTSGMILTASALLRVNPNPSEDQIRHFMEGNICRCGTYPRIVDAIQRAAAAAKKSES